MRWRSALLFTLGVVALAPSPASAKGGKLSLAVTDLRASGAEAQAATALTTEVTNSLAGLGVFAVISGEDIKRLLSLEETRQGCTGNADAACLAEIGGALGVDYLVYGEVAKIAGTYNLSLVLLDTAKASAVNRGSKKITEAGKLLEETGLLARALVQPLLESKRGSLMLDVRERGAKIAVDGKTVGTAPIGRLALAMGPHEVLVEKPGFLSFARTVEVLPDQVTVEAVMLVPNQEFIDAYESSAGLVRAAAWITAGSAVALLGTAGVLRLVDDARFSDLVAKRYLEVRGVCADLSPGYNGTDYCPTELGQENGVLDTVRGIETVDSVALGLAIAGAASAAASVILFVTGDPPGHYAPFSASVAETAGASWSIGPRGAEIGLDF